MAFVYWIHLPEHTNVLSEGYIGFTSKTVEHRFKGHLKEVALTKAKNYPLYNSMRKYSDRIIVSTLVEGSDEYCLDIEFRLRPSTGIGWNICCGGSAHGLGKRRTPESIAKIKKNGTGLKRTQSTKDNISKGLSGVPKSVEHCVKLSSSAKQRTAEHQMKLTLAAGNISEDTRELMSLSAKERFKDTPWLHPSANCRVWALSNTVSEMCKVGVKLVKMVASLECTEAQVRTIRKKLKAGWTPTEDSAYMSWLTEYKEKECYGT